MRRTRSIAIAIAVLANWLPARAADTSTSCHRPGLTPPVALTSHAATSEDYPPLSRMLNETGTSVVVYEILPDGSVDGAKVTTSSGSLRLDDAALAFVKRFKFQPALLASVATQCTSGLALKWEMRTDDQGAVSALAAFTASPIYVPRSDFPPGAAERNEEGFAVAVVFVSEHNSIDQIILARPTQFADLNSATVSLVGKRNVTSPTIGGAPSRSMIAIPVVWSLGKPLASAPLVTPDTPAPPPEVKAPDGVQAPSENNGTHSANHNDDHVKIKNLKLGLVCGPDQSRRVCFQTSDIQMTGEGRCTFNNELIGCTWYGLSFDYELPEDKVELTCNWSSNVASDMGTPAGLDKPAATEGPFKIVLNGRAGHFINPQYTGIGRGGPSKTQDLREVCQYKGASVYDIVFHLHFPEN